LWRDIKKLTCGGGGGGGGPRGSFINTTAAAQAPKSPGYGMRCRLYSGNGGVGGGGGGGWWGAELQHDAV